MLQTYLAAGFIYHSHRISSSDGW